MSYNTFKRAEVTKDEYDKILATQKANGTKYREQVTGGRKSLYVGKILVASIVNSNSLQLDNVSDKEFVQLLAVFQKNVNKSLLTDDNLFGLSIPYSGYSKAKNKEIWVNLGVSQCFYSFDISNAYWQFAYRLGYISRSLYEDYAYIDNFKTAKRYCVTFLARGKKMSYTDSNGLKYDINCDNRIYDKVYSNIRNAIYQAVSDIREGLDDGWVEFNTDGVSVLPIYADLVKDRFKKLGLEFKITLCRKVNDHQYSSGIKVKNFSTKINKQV